MSDLFRQMNIANGHRHEETASLGEALHFQQVNEVMKKRIRKQRAEGQHQSMGRRAARHQHEFSDIQMRLKTEELYLAMTAGMRQPGLNATWP